MQSAHLQHHKTLQMTPLAVTLSDKILIPVITAVYNHAHNISTHVAIISYQYHVIIMYRMQP